MGYGLGIDLGTTFTAAAIDRDGHIEMVSLGDRAAVIPSVVLLRGDGTVLIGDAADRRAAVESDRVAREFKRRLGDPTPVLLGGAPHSVASLMAHLLGHVVRVVSGQQGGPPTDITLTHPANWGPYKKELFAQVPRLTGIDRVGLVTEPEAAAAHYASQERVEEGSVVAVYDLGGGTFDATVLRKRGQAFEILGTPEGIEGLGGIDFDEAVFGHVDRALEGRVSQINPDDPAAVSAVVRLRQECVLAKEALSADTETVIPVLLPGGPTEVRLTRGEFEEMIRPSIAATIQSLRRALGSADVEAANLSAVLLVGGSSRIPLVSQLVSADLGRPTAVDIHPKYGVALGAAALASGRSRLRQVVSDPTVSVAPTTPPTRQEHSRVMQPVVPAAFGAGAPPPVLGRGGKSADSKEKRRRNTRRGLLIGITALAVAAIAGVAVAVSNGSGSPGDTNPGAPAETTVDTPATTDAAQPVGTEPQAPAAPHTTQHHSGGGSQPTTSRSTQKSTSSSKPTSTTAPTSMSEPLPSPSA
jgi:molecular chaperone DnaK (HSP70)